VILLMLDFDGTLAPIRRRPEEAGIEPKTRRLLEALGKNPLITLAVISGRSLADVREKTGVRGIAYAGCHGLEMEGPGWSFVHPKARRLRPLLKRAASELSAALGGLPGVMVEDKGLAVSVHYRKAGARGAGAAERAVSHTLSKYRNRLKPGRGRKVLELLPDVAWDKGRAVGLLLARHRRQRPCPVYIGDDLTDEAAFRAVRGRGLGILVESRERTGGSDASLRFGSTRQVIKLLKALLPVGTGEGRGGQ
jgi:trehalose-phosphatase